jgi:hypothetical protein
MLVSRHKTLKQRAKKGINHPFNLKPLTRYQLTSDGISTWFMTDGNGNIIESKLTTDVLAFDKGGES